MSNTKRIINSMNDCLEKMTLITLELDSTYNELSENIWSSKEKKKLDLAVQTSLNELKKYEKNMKTNTSFLNNYNNEYIELYNMLNDVLGSK